MLRAKEISRRAGPTQDHARQIGKGKRKKREKLEFIHGKREEKRKKEERSHLRGKANTGSPSAGRRTEKDDSGR